MRASDEGCERGCQTLADGEAFGCFFDDSTKNCRESVISSSVIFRWEISIPVNAGDNRTYQRRRTGSTGGIRG